jgi:hypothetical protein
VREVVGSDVQSAGADLCEILDQTGNCRGVRRMMNVAAEDFRGTEEGTYAGVAFDVLFNSVSGDGLLKCAFLSICERRRKRCCERFGASE